MMNHRLRDGRREARLTQMEAAARLGVSQPYLSQLERGRRPVTPVLARSAAALYRLPATALPVPDTVSVGAPVNPAKLARQLTSLGYPGFAHLGSGSKANPAAVVLEALLQPELEVRLSEALPWVLLTYPDLDWQWLVGQSKFHDVQNRLGFVVAVARAVATRHAGFSQAEGKLAAVEQQLERVRLAREDTLGRESMPSAERRWLAVNRSPAARHWNVLTSLSDDQLSYAV
ncbi:MAG: helix-turn-helix transcriptional regulator [Burkholderiales bacterium]